VHVYKRDLKGEEKNEKKGMLKGKNRESLVLVSESWQMRETINTGDVHGESQLIEFSYTHNELQVAKHEGSPDLESGGGDHHESKKTSRK